MKIQTTIFKFQLPAPNRNPQELRMHPSNCAGELHNTSSWVQRDRLARTRRAQNEKPSMSGFQNTWTDMKEARKRIGRKFAKTPGGFQRWPALAIIREEFYSYEMHGKLTSNMDDTPR